MRLRKTSQASLAILAVLGSCVLQIVGAQSLYQLPNGVETRWASPENPRGDKGRGGQANAGRKGSPAISLKAGEQRVLAEVSGTSGTVRRIWMTVSDRTPRMLRAIRLDIYWDGAPSPAVSAPLGDFFGVSLGGTAVFQSALFSSPEGRSFNSYVPMPFRTGMKLVVANESDVDLAGLYYDVDYTVGDKHDADVLYFHAHFRRENPTRMRRDYELLPKVVGKGRFLGVNVGVIADRTRYAGTWWGEGEVKVYLDGDKELPTLNGTGTEDYIGSGFSLGPYAHLYQGALIVDNARLRYSFYRYHIEDPIYFQQDIRVAIQQIGILLPKDFQAIAAIPDPLYKAGPEQTEIDKSRSMRRELFEREDDWSSCAYFYLNTPENKLPRLIAASDRIAGL